MNAATILDRIEEALVMGAPADIVRLQELLPRLTDAGTHDLPQMVRIRRLTGNLRQFLCDLGLPCADDGAQAYTAIGLCQPAALVTPISLG